MQRTTVVVDKASDGHCICLRSRRLITYYPTTNELMDLATALAPYGICRGERSLCCDAEMDDLFKKALAAAGEERVRLTEQLVRKWYNEVPMLTLFTLSYVAGLRQGLEYTPNPNGEFRFFEIRSAK